MGRENTDPNVVMTSREVTFTDGDTTAVRIELRYTGVPTPLLLLRPFLLKVGTEFDGDHREHQRSRKKACERPQGARPGHSVR